MEIKSKYKKRKDGSHLSAHAWGNYYELVDSKMGILISIEGTENLEQRI